MVHEGKPIHHRHTRKRNTQSKHSFPSKDKKIEFLDRLVLLVAIAFPIVTIPQVFKIWFEQNAQGVSLFSWSMYLVLSIPMLLYGIVHKDKPITLMYSLWIIIYVFIISGVIIYG